MYIVIFYSLYEEVGVENTTTQNMWTKCNMNCEVCLSGLVPKFYHLSTEVDAWGKGRVEEGL